MTEYKSVWAHYNDDTQGSSKFSARSPQFVAELGIIAPTGGKDSQEEQESRSGAGSGSTPGHHKNSCQLNFPLKFALLLLRTFSKSHYGLINCKNELGSELRYPSFCLLRKLNSIIFSVRTALASCRGYRLNKDEDFSPRMEMIQKNQHHQPVHWSSNLMGWIWVSKTEWNIVLIPRYWLERRGIS